ncbi:hypothetical protein M2347_003827 [Chryseobacterium sp. H1D6B]|uniref:YiiX/YebB-like N1pC/P60 family cysteine hydrolase n=1 Tax=Chryseobacterium sp. H1D6B TaxID=2940588 RepID=UPI0015CDBBFC|nr:YiiX/YebB-like N1pC/P60 family cysteine hydrolase [Chryseobacterium sp. H1D6B]MDH6254100.1 hypothetical protein [Chryseobacterium sp. H1D6B]
MKAFKGNTAKYLTAMMGLVLIIAIFSFHKSPSLNNKVKNLGFEKETLYLVQRGTTGKLGNVAKEFNISNKYASHLGIGFIENNTLTIYHVYVDKNPQNTFLYIESIDNFIKPEDLNYLSVWKLKNIAPTKFNAVKNSLIQSEKEKINFDFNFDESDKAYYCSEYIVKELKKNGVEIMTEHKKDLSGMIKQILKKDTLTYFPVDGFENTHKAVKIFEWIK